MPPMLSTGFQAASSKPGCSQPFAATLALFHCPSLITSGGASTPTPAGTIFATITCPEVSCRTSALLPGPETPRPRTASIAIVFSPGRRYSFTLAANTWTPSGELRSPSTCSASLPFTHTFTLRGPAM